MANSLPVVNILDQSVGANATKNISSAVSVTDGNGDTISKYKVKDTAGSVNNFIVNGSEVDATGDDGYEFASSALSTLSVKGDSSAGIQRLQIAAYDGTAWGDWTDFTLTTQVANTVPTLSVNMPTLSPSTWTKYLSLIHI